MTTKVKKWISSIILWFNKESKSQVKYNNEVEKLAASLNIMCSKRKDSNEWLRHLYSEYHQLALYSTGVIWKTGAILLTLSLTGLPVLARMNICMSKWYEPLLIMLAPFSMMAFWLIVAENNRAISLKAFAWMDAIRKTIYLEDKSGPKLRLNVLSEITTRTNVGQYSRWILTIIVLTLWGFVVSNL